MFQSINKTHLDKKLQVIEDNNLLFWSQLDIEIHYDACSTRLVTGIPHAFYNGILRSRFPIKNITDQIEHTLHYFERRNLPFSWWTNQLSSPVDLGQRLEQRGFVSIGALPAMVCSLEGGRVRYEVVKLPLLSFEWVESDKEHKEWASVIREGFSIEPSSQKEYTEFFMKGKMIGDKLYHLLGRFETIPVAAATLFIHDGVAGIYNLCVAPKWRCKGIGSAVMSFLLEAARLLNCSMVIMQTYPAAVEVCERFGFKSAGDFHCYIKQR